MEVEEIQNIIFSTLQEILSVTGNSFALLNKSHDLHLDLGLNSLQLARLIALLETRFKFDPFASKLSITSIKTVNDLIEAYALSQPTHIQRSQHELLQFQENLVKRRKLNANL